MNIKTKKEDLINYMLVYGKDKSWEELKEQFELPTAEIARHTWKTYKKANKILDIANHSELQNTVAELEDKVVQLTEDLKKGTGEATISLKKEIKDLKDLEGLVDLNKWDIVKYTQGCTSGRYSVKAWLELKKPNEAKFILDSLQNYKSTWKPIDKKDLTINSKWADPTLLVLNLNDLHFDKLDLTNNTIDERIKDFKTVLENLVLKSYNTANIDHILFVIGNDMFNTDNIHNTTTNGTPQSVNATWDVAYEKVFTAMADSIAYLKTFCNELTVMLVPGNHDRTKSYYLAHGLETYFRNDKSIIFDRSSCLKKVFTYGETFLGFNHGNNINDKLPLAFATEFIEEWGECKYHDILISDKHHSNEKKFSSNQTQNEYQGVRVRILPSLSSADRWHSDNLFHSRQSGIALLYDKVRGKSAEFEHQAL